MTPILPSPHEPSAFGATTFWPKPEFVARNHGSSAPTTARTAAAGTPQATSGIRSPVAGGGPAQFGAEGCWVPPGNADVGTAGRAGGGVP